MSMYLLCALSPKWVNIFLYSSFVAPSCFGCHHQRAISCLSVGYYPDAMDEVFVRSFQFTQDKLLQCFLIWQSEHVGQYEQIIVHFRQCIWNFQIDYSDVVGKISYLSHGVALFPHETFFSSLQFFGKSYRTTMLLLLFIYKNVYARFFAHRSVVIY